MIVTANSVLVRDGISVRRLTFREFGRMREQAKAGQDAGDPQDVAFVCALLSACAVTESGDPAWADYEAVANDDRALMVSEIAAAATEVNGLSEDADEGNASPDSQS